MSYAIIETGGKQVRVEPGRFYDIELLPVEPEEKVTIDKVLLVKHEDDVHIGQPWVEGATVQGTVLRHFRGRKVIVYKMRRKKKTRKKRGHRQEITRLMIDAIALNGSVLAGSDDAQAATPAPVAEPATPEPAAETESAGSGASTTAVATPPTVTETEPEVAEAPAAETEPKLVTETSPQLVTETEPERVEETSPQLVAQTEPLAAKETSPQLVTETGPETAEDKSEE